MAAWVSVLISACGEGGAAAPDARRADATVEDAAPDAATDGPVVDAPIDGPPADAAPLVDLTQLDPGFAGDGYRDLRDGTSASVAVQPDQKLVVCAASSLGGSVYRLLPGGDLDPAFAGGAPIPAASAGCADVAILADGRIAVASFPAGTDSLVSADGTTVTPVGRPTAAAGTSLITNHFLPTADGGFFLAMDQARTVAPMQLVKTSAVARYAASGMLVPSFGEGGLAVLSYGATAELGLDARATQVALVSVAGTDHLVVATARADVVAVSPATGAVDGTFATAFGDNRQPVALTAGAPGHAIVASGVPFGAFMARTTALAIAASGQVTGQASTTYCGDVPENAAVAGLAVDADRRPVFVLRQSRDGVTVQLARATADVTALDPAWGCGRGFRLPSLCPDVGACDQITTRATDAALAADGSVVVVGYRWRLGTAARVFVARVRAAP